MRDFAERSFFLGASEKAGEQTVTRRELYEGLLKRTRRPDKIAEYESLLALPPFPRPLHYLWRVFQRLRNRRTSNGFGANPITWADIGEFMRLSGFRLTPWEVEVIEELDILDRNEIARAASGQSQEVDD